MPILTADQIIARLEGRIAQLEAGEEIAKKDIYALLTDAQQRALEGALAAQVQLKQEKRARSDEEKKALGWKTIREVRIEVMKQALKEANDGILDAFKRMQRDVEIRQMKIYMAALAEAKKQGKDKWSAECWANNELTRAGLARMDGARVRHMSERDREVAKMEAALREQFKAEMTPEELEQQQMLEDLDKQEVEQIKRGKFGVKNLKIKGLGKR
jgi:hypothetical protein